MRELLEKYVGKKASIEIGGLTVDVKIVDVKKSYGKERYLVNPVAGQGEVWVENVTLDK